MIVRNRHKLTLSALAILIFAIVLFLWLIASKLAQRESDVGYILIPARESRPVLYLEEGPFSSEDFMIVQQSVNHPAVTEPISDRQTDSALIEHDCGTLTVTIDGDRNVALNTDSMGTLNDTSQLATKLTEVFQQRVAQRAYLPGMETRTDLPDIQRIPRTVLIRGALFARYGDVVTLIDLLKELRADPIGLQINHFPA
jgi:biopolymer transport protein ExbD